MNELIRFLENNPGPWAVGFTTSHEEKPELTAGSFHAECSKFEISEAEDSICFYTPAESDGHHITEVLLPTDSLELISIEDGIAVFANSNFEVKVEGFLPNIIVYIQPLK